MASFCPSSLRHRLYQATCIGSPVRLKHVQYGVAQQVPGIGFTSGYTRVLDGLKAILAVLFHSQIPCGGRARVVAPKLHNDMHKRHSYLPLLLPLTLTLDCSHSEKSIWICSSSFVKCESWEL